MKENHSKFLRHLNDSSDSVFIVARYLYDKGLDVRINSLKRAKRHSDWKNYKDDGDLFVYKNDNEFRIEVKGLSCDFTNKSDWCFRDFIVCAKHSFDLANKKPSAYFILNKQRTHIAIVRTKYFDKWNVVSRKDTRYDSVTQEFYTCSLDDIEWIKI